MCEVAIEVMFKVPYPIFVKRNHQRAREAGGESASPRRWRSRAWGTEPKRFPSPRSGRQMKRELEPFRLRVFHSSTRNCHQLRRLSVITDLTPGSASPSPGASTLSARFAGWLNGSSNMSVPLSGETLDG